MSDQKLTIERKLKAPKSLVWDVHCEPEHLKNWFGPQGSTMDIKHFEFKPGGKLHYSITSPEGTMWGLVKYQEIEPTDRMTYTNAFSDENENLVRHPMSDTWPLEMHNDMTFEEIPEGTLVALVVTPINASAEEIATFIGAGDNVKGGFEGMFQVLDQYLSKIK